MILKNGQVLGSSTARVGVIIDTCDFEDKETSSRLIVFLV